jgi:hypothetical protein
VILLCNSIKYSVELCFILVLMQLLYNCYRYRGFPNIKSQKVDVTSARSHVCNFLGTVYGNSSREILSHVIKSMDLQDNCIILERKR